MKLKFTAWLFILFVIFCNSITIGQSVKREIKESTIIPESEMNIPLPGPFQAAQETNANFATTVYTFGDITVFSYFDNTSITVYDATGTQKGTQTLNTDKYYTFNYGSGVYRIVGNKTYTVLVGDAITSTVNGFFAVDEAGRGVSTKLNTWMSKQYSSSGDDFIIFAYENSTGFTVRNLTSGNVIAAGSLNAGEHYSFKNGVGVPWNTPLQVTGTKPVSALSYEDQDYYVPSSNGSFVGTLFYGYSAYNGSWQNSITVTSYTNNNSITIRNTTTGQEIGTATLQAGQVYSSGITTPTYWSVTSTGPVSAANIPFFGWTGSYYYMTRAIDQTGKGFGTLFYVPTIGSNIHVFSYENGNSVKITRMGAYNQFPYTTPTEVWTGSLDEGKFYNFSSSSGNYVYKIEASKNASVIQSNGGAGADFVPLAYSADYPDLAISTSDIVYSKADTDILVGDLITVTVTVHNYGNVAASNVVCYAYEGDPDAGGNAPLIGSGTIASIAVGGTGTFTFQYRVPTSPEYRFIVIKADPTNQITESNESNNKATRSIKPNGDLLPPLAVNVTAPSSLTLTGGVLSPNPFTVKFDIFNTGTVNAGNCVVTLELFNGLTTSGALVQNLGDIPGNGTKSATYQINANASVSGFNLYRATITASNAPAKVVSRSVNVPDGTAPSAPVNLAGQVTGSGAASLTWNNNSESDLAGYYLYYGTDGTNWNGTGAAQGNSPILVIGRNNFSITGMPTGLRYFMLKAFDTSNNLSSMSNVLQLNFSGQTTTQELFYGNTAYNRTVSTEQGGWGYVAGTNSYGDIGKYQRFDLTTSAVLTGTKFYFAGKTITGNADNFAVVVKQRDAATGAPGTTLYSQSYSTSVIDVTTPGTSHNYFAISPGINLSSPFFIGIEWVGTIDDRFGLIMDGDKEGNNEKRAWEKWDTGAFHAMADEWNTMDSDLWIAAQIQVASGVEDGEEVIPTGYALHQNYPNPFNPSTVISYQLPNAVFVRLRVFDVLGNQVASLVNNEQHAGYYNVTFNANNLTSGIYFYRLEAGNYSETKKLILIK